MSVYSAFVSRVAPRVKNYATGEDLPGVPSDALVAASAAAAPTGAAAAYRDDAGVWQYVPEDRTADYARMGAPCTTVWLSW